MHKKRLKSDRLDLKHLSPSMCADTVAFPGKSESCVSCVNVRSQMEEMCVGASSQVYNSQVPEQPNYVERFVLHKGHVSDLSEARDKLYAFFLVFINRVGRP